MTVLKKLWLPMLIISLLLNAFSVFYVAVGATAESEISDVPEGVFDSESEDESDPLLIKKKKAAAELSMPMHSLKDGEVKLDLLDSSHYTKSIIYEMEYTVKKAYLSDTLPEGYDNTQLTSVANCTDGVLDEGYTFLLVDVIIENKSSEKQMYLVNAAKVSGYPLCGFTGQRFKNTAALHAELYPNEPFEATLIYTVSKDLNEVYQLIINNFGYGSTNGTCACVDLEIEK